MKEKIVVLIGGAPTVGKSTVARLLSEHLRIPWISSDQIREVMKATVDEKNFPALFDTKDYTAERFLTEFSSSEIVKMEINEGEAVWPGVQAFIEESYPWNSFIVEGVAILPHLVARDFSNRSWAQPVFLVDEDADRIRNVVFNRGLWDDAKTYSDDVKEKEVQWAMLFSHMIRVEAEKYHFPWIEMKKNDKEDLRSILNQLGLSQN